MGVIAWTLTHNIPWICQINQDFQHFLSTVGKRQIFLKEPLSFTILRYEIIRSFWNKMTTSPSHGVWIIIKSQNHLCLAYFGLGITHLVFLYILSHLIMMTALWGMNVLTLQRGKLKLKVANWIAQISTAASSLASIQIQGLWTPSQVFFFFFFLLYHRCSKNVTSQRSCFYFFCCKAS